VVDLGFAADYVILTKTGISTVPDSVITGDIPVSHIAAEAMTGFSFTADPSTGTFSASSQITGKAWAANYIAPTPATLTTAVGAMETAYTDAAGRVNPDAARINYGGGLLGGDFGGATDKLTPGVYTFTTDVLISGDIHFNGSDIDIFIIQITGNLNQDANYDVILEGGALAKSIFWQVAGAVTVGAGAHMEGVLLVKTHVVFETLSSMSGRILSQTACTLGMATITEPAL
jgi:hypothetical protein